jgi:hypothetical protein
MGASCFTHRVRTTPVPKGFKLSHDQQKYDGSQEPQSWLSDYLQAIKILGGTKETAMQSLQLHLTRAARSWLSKLEKETIGSWEELRKQFTSNFKSIYKRPAFIEEVKACVQQCNETLRVYIQRWSIIKNSAVEVSDERAIDAFTLGLRRGDLVEEMGRLKPKIVSDLMDIQTGSQMEKTCVTTNGAVGYKDNSYQGNDRRSSGYHSYGKEDYGSIKKFQTREPREYNSSPEHMLNGPCHIHSAFVDGKRVSRHAIKDCTTFLKLQEAALNKQAKAKRQVYEGNTNNMKGFAA